MTGFGLAHRRPALSFRQLSSSPQFACVWVVLALMGPPSAASVELLCSTPLLRTLCAAPMGWLDTMQSGT
eukprot:12017383-Karenia_brevis.AAC.1